MQDYILIIIIAIIIFIVLLYFIKTYNRFVILRNRMKDQQAQIDVQLKRRYDLIPNLVETVKGCAGFEKSTLEAVTAARTGAVQAQNFTEAVAANDALTSALHKLLAVSESYPDLKSSGNFMHLQEELSETEDKISKARQFYNDTVLKYNNAIQTFPANLVAGLTGHREGIYLQAAEGERETVKVSF